MSNFNNWNHAEYDEQAIYHALEEIQRQRSRPACGPWTRLRLAWCRWRRPVWACDPAGHCHQEH